MGVLNKYRVSGSFMALIVDVKIAFR